jgi:ATP-dependent Clp protease ATP-binding subunit ClpX
MATRNAYCSFCRKSYRDVGPLVEGPGDVYICGDCLELCQSILDQEKRRRAYPQEKSPHLASAEEVLSRIGQLVRGQEEATRTLVLAARRHYQRLPGAPREDAGPILLTGPTRSSKIFLARALAHALGVPFAWGDGNELHGLNCEDQRGASVLYKLLGASGFDIEAARRGLVYLDGMDQPDNQRLLLAASAEKAAYSLPHGLRLELGGVLFIGGGTFVGLDLVMTRRGRHPEQAAGPDDLLAFGALPEFVRSLRAIVGVPPLNEETLMRLVSRVDLGRPSDGGASTNAPP